MTDAERDIQQRALEYARRNKKAIARRLTRTADFPSENEPVSVFMAGSPGAGKTEASKELLKELGDGKVLRIDPDELRVEFTDYDGTNSWLFQGSVSILVEKILDFALDQKQSFLLDGTLSNLQIAIRNIDRSLGKGRVAQILYVYQEPQFAWRFVQARENKEGRNIRPEDFVKQYFDAREVVEALKVKFKQAVKVDLLVKNLDGSGRIFHANVDQIEAYVPEKFSREQVLEIVRKG